MQIGIQDSIVYLIFGPLNLVANAILIFYFVKLKQMKKGPGYYYLFLSLAEIVQVMILIVQALL